LRDKVQQLDARAQRGQLRFVRTIPPDVPCAERRDGGEREGNRGRATALQ